MRKTSLRRTTTETDILVRLNLDGRGRAKVSTGIPFLDHMLTLVARHGAMDLELTARGDLDVDQHHTVEDTGIVLGEAIKKALGSKRGILRAGYFLMPMDETLAAAAIDFSGRPHLVCKWKFSAGCSMAARRTIKWRRFSRRSLARSGLPPRAIHS